MIPTATLRIECSMPNSPMPTRGSVFVDGRMVAVFTLDELKRAAEELERLENAARISFRFPPNF
jgi:hypothetical protein